MDRVADGAAGELDGVAVAAGGADPADHREDDILRRDAGRQPAFDPDQHVLHLLRHQALGRQHMLDLGSADAVGQRAEGAVGGSVRVAADHGHPRRVAPCSGPTTWTMPLAHVVHLSDSSMPKSSQFSTVCTAARTSSTWRRMLLQPVRVVGTLWSGVAMLASIRHGRARQAKTLEGTASHFVQDMGGRCRSSAEPSSRSDQVHVPRVCRRGSCRAIGISSSAYFYAHGVVRMILWLASRTTNHIFIQRLPKRNPLALSSRAAETSGGPQWTWEQPQHLHRHCRTG